VNGETVDHGLHGLERITQIYDFNLLPACSYDSSGTCFYHFII